MYFKEIISGRPPYANIKNDSAVVHAIVDKKEIPKRPGRISTERTKGDVLWSLLQRCWTFEPRERLGAAEVENQVSFGKNATPYINIVVILDEKYQAIRHSISSHGSICDF